MIPQKGQFINYSLRILLSVFACLWACIAVAQADPSTCHGAVKATNQYLESFERIADANFNSGRYTRTEYLKIVSDLQLMKDQVSVDTCMASDIIEFQLFECLLQNKGNYPFCQSSVSG